MTILGIDTSSMEYTSIGFYFSDNETMEINLKAPLSQEEKLFFAIDSGLKILKKDIKDIDVFAAGIGPGSFTGLRIGIAGIKSMAWSLSKKIVPVSSLDLLNKAGERNIFEKNILTIPVIDARMNRVFSAFYLNGDNISGEMDIEPHLLMEKVIGKEYKKIVFLGNGLNRHADIFRDIPGKEIFFIPEAYIHGMDICRLALDSIAKNPGILSDSYGISPVYLRKSEAELQIK